MSFASGPVLLGTGDTDIYVAGALVEAGLKLLVTNVHASLSRDHTLKFYKASTAATTTFVNAASVAAKGDKSYTVPFTLEPGDKLIGSASAASSIIVMPAIIEGAANPVAKGLNPRGDYSDVTTYEKNDMVYVAGFGTYVSRVDANIGHDPELSPAQWMTFAMDGEAGAIGPSGTSALSIVRVMAGNSESVTTDFEPGDTIDGIVVAQGDIVFRNQITAPELNGLYVVQSSGAALRHPDFDTFDEHAGRYISVREGNVFGRTLWLCVSALGGTLGTTALLFVKNDPVYEDAKRYRVLGDAASSDTTLLKRAIDNAYLQGRRFIAPKGQYRVGELDLTNKTGLVIEGNGEGTVFLADVGSGGCMIDLSGSERIRLRNFRVERYSTQRPDVIFKWMGTPTVDCDFLTFENVSVDAPSTYAHLYGYDVNGLSFRGDCPWFQRYVGVSTTDPEKRTSVIHLTADNANSLNLTSSHVTVATGVKVAGQVSMSGNVRFDAYPDGAGAGNAVAAIFRKVQCLHAANTKFLSMGKSNVVIWDHSENLMFPSCEFRDSGGAGLINTHAVEIGGGLNSVMIFDNTLMTDLVNGGCYFGVGPKMSSTDGGIATLIVRNNDIGGNAFSNKMVGLTKSWVVGDDLSVAWMTACDIDCFDFGVEAAGNISNDTILRRPGTVTTHGGTTKGIQIKSTGIELPAAFLNKGDFSAANGKFTVAAGDGAVGFSGPADATFTQVLNPLTGIKGVSTNSAAAAGIIGEIITGTLASGSAVALSSTVSVNVTSISLTAGDWDVSGVVYFSGGATTRIYQTAASVSTTSATLDVTAGNFNKRTGALATWFTYVTEEGLPAPAKRISLASTTTVYLVAMGQFDTSTMAAFGNIRARRVR